MFIIFQYFIFNVRVGLYSIYYYYYLRFTMENVSEDAFSAFLKGDPRYFITL